VQLGRASETARRVAAQRLTFARVPGPGRPEDDEALHRDVADGLRWAPTPMTRYLAARTAFFDRAVVGWRGPQVVALGAGYDGRSLRYAGARWWELDHPATQADKLARLARLGIAPTAVFVAADFLVDELGLPGHAPGLPTLFLCEGLLAYLPGTAVERLLTWAASVAAPGSRLVAEVPVTPLDEGSSTRAALRRDVARVGEPMAEPWVRSSVRQRFSTYHWSVESAVDARGAPIESSALTAALVTAAVP
jgi:methyltransferase (TIGR00027 family)